MDESEKGEERWKGGRLLQKNSPSLMTISSNALCQKTAGLSCSFKRTREDAEVF